LAETEKALTGIAGLDDILAGGLTRGHALPIEGEPGAGHVGENAPLLRAKHE
jgi:circadian clock protein KaiC